MPRRRFSLQHNLFTITLIHSSFISLVFSFTLTIIPTLVLILIYTNNLCCTTSSIALVLYVFLSSTLLTTSTPKFPSNFLFIFSLFLPPFIRTLHSSNLPFSPYSSNYAYYNKITFTYFFALCTRSSHAT